MLQSLTTNAVGLDPPKPVEATRPERAEKKPETTTEKVSAAREESAEAKDPVVNREAAAEAFSKAFDSDFPSGAALDIEVNDNAGGFIYKAVDPETGEVLKQFPAAEVIERLERMAKRQGIAVDGKV